MGNDDGFFFNRCKFVQKLRGFLTSFLPLGGATVTNKYPSQYTTLSTEGTLKSREPKEVQLFLLMFYPPKGLCKADTEGGPIVFTYVLFCLRKRILDFFFNSGFWPFLNLQNVLSPGGTLLSRARKGSNCFYLCFIGVGRGTGGFKFCGGERPF